MELRGCQQSLTEVRIVSRFDDIEPIAYLETFPDDFPSVTRYARRTGAAARGFTAVDIYFIDEGLVFVMPDEVEAQQAYCEALPKGHKIQLDGNKIRRC